MKLKPNLDPSSPELKKYPLILTRGLPASGKTTWAKDFARKNGYNIISRDDIRRDIFGGGRILKGFQEGIVSQYQEALISTGLMVGQRIISCDTYLNPNSFKLIDKITDDYAIADFTGVSLYECMRRDMDRLDSVGNNVIANMFESYLKPAVVFNPNLPSVYLVDIDGTVATMHPSRKAFEWDKVHLDEPKTHVINLLKNKNVIFFSGRDSECYDLTKEWLLKHFDPTGSFQLYMRANKDNRKDYIVKKEMYYEHIHGKCNVEAVIDDRLSVCCMWVELGLNLIRIGNPLLDF